MKKYMSYLSFPLFIIVWWSIAEIKDSFLFPGPMAVFSKMVSQCLDPSFYHIIMTSFMRCMSGLIIALFLGTLLAIIAGLYPIFEMLLTPFMAMIKSIPNISYILIILVWFTTETSSVIIILFILIPIFYANILESFKQMDPDLKGTLEIYRVPLFKRLHQIYLPATLPYLLAALSTSLGLAFKVGIMSEILGGVSIGIGKQLKFSQINLDMISIFAWTGWIILILTLLESILRYWRKKMDI